MLGGAVLFGGVLGPVLLLWGLSSAPAVSVALWLNLETVATTLLAWAFFREHVHGRMWASSTMVLGASILLAAPFEFGVGIAALMVTLACVCWGLDNNFTAVIDRFTPAQTTFTKGLVAGVVNLSLGVWFEGQFPPVLAALAALGVGIFSYGVSLVLYIRGAQQMGAMRSQMVFATAPFWGVIMAWSFLAESVTPVQLVATGIMLGALWMIYTERHDHEHAHQTVTHTHLHRHDDRHHDHPHPSLPGRVWHTHEHEHESITHIHPHRPDLHHRHEHLPPHRHANQNKPTG